MFRKRRKIATTMTSRGERDESQGWSPKIWMQRLTGCGYERRICELCLAWFC